VVLFSPHTGNHAQKSDFTHHHQTGWFFFAPNIRNPEHKSFHPSSPLREGLFATHIADLEQKNSHPSSPHRVVLFWFLTLETLNIKVLTPHHNTGWANQPLTSVTLKKTVKK